MDSTFAQLKKLIDASSLAQEDKERIFVVFESGDNETLDSLLRLFTEDPKWIQEISDNLKAKEAAFAANDMELWDKIVEAETERLKAEEE